MGALEGVKLWVLQYGARARVLAPEALREMVRRKAADMLTYYQTVESTHRG
ncbi:MAG: WYL domain-containing protein [Acidobacteriota bacterium]|nr:WYL domain-containing protein [Acidobacteriota bacterium]